MIMPGCSSRTARLPHECGCSGAAARRYEPFERGDLRLPERADGVMQERIGLSTSTTSAALAKPSADLRH